MAGAATTKFVEETWESGKKWLRDYFKDHKETVQKNAEQNALFFLNDLSKRIKVLEESIKDSEQSKIILEGKLNDPDFAAMLQKALIASSRSSSQYKHEILSRVVADRLGSNSQTLDLASSMAVDSIQYLSDRHLNLLGVIIVIDHLRPEGKEIKLSKPEDFPSWYTNWLIEHLSWIPVNLEFDYLDYMHLQSTSCLSYMEIGTRKLNKMLIPELENQKTNPWSFEEFAKTEVGQKIEKLWETGMNKASLTTTGMLIGTYVVDNKLKTKTKIDWT